MNINYKGILEALSDASPSHLALASFILLPVVLDYWLQAILKLFPNPENCIKIISILAFFVIYAICLIWMALESSSKRKRIVKRDLILGRLTSNDWSEVGFDSLRNALGDDFTDQEIHNVIQSFPKTLRPVRMRVKDKKGDPKQDEQGKPKYKPGVGLVVAKKAMQ